MAPLSRFEPGDGRAHSGTEPGRMYQVPKRTGWVACAAHIGRVAHPPPRGHLRSASPAGAGRRRCGYAAAVPPTASWSRRFVLCAAAVVLFAAVLGGCSGEAATSFDPTGACTSDGSVPGAYPELEALVPGTYRGEPPALLDSGRNCSVEALGTLAERFEEVRFAGGTWTFGGERAVVLVVFSAPGLDAQAMAEFYVQPARTAPRTEILAQSNVSIAGRPGQRLDTRRVDRLHTVVVWPSAQPDQVNVVITSDLPEPRVQDAIEAFGDD